MTSFTQNHWNRVFNCTHSEPYSIYCNQDTCWEAKGMSSRLIEKQMKGKKNTGYMLSHPHDSDDFSRCVKIVNANNWKPRLGEMCKYGIVWSRIIKSWDHLEELLNANKLEELNKKLSGFDVLNGELKTFLGPIDSFVFNKNFVVGSQLVQPHLQYDEADLSPCVVLDKFPITWIKYYKPDGSSLGAKSANYMYHIKSNMSSIESVKKEDSPLIKGIIDALDAHVKSNIEQWYTSSFELCPHLCSIHESTDSSEMYFAQVFDLDEQKEFGYCLISFEPGHQLDPALNTNNDCVEFEGYKWTVSPEPIKINTLYLTDGLLNACPDDVQVDISEFDQPTQEPTDQPTTQLVFQNISISLG